MQRLSGGIALTCWPIGSVRIPEKLLLAVVYGTRVYVGLFIHNCLLSFVVMPARLPIQCHKNLFIYFKHVSMRNISALLHEGQE